jgi:hypothetical protein
MRGFLVIERVFETRTARAQKIQRFVAYDAEYPGAHTRTASKPAGLPPDFVKRLGHRVIRIGFVAEHAQREGERRTGMAGMQGVERPCVTAGAGSDEIDVIHLRKAE